jgi:hypothetical protein
MQLLAYRDWSSDVCSSDLAVLALWCYSILNSKIEIYDAEMSNTSSQVVDFFIKSGEAR